MSKKTIEADSSFSRRSVIKSLGAGAVAVTGFSAATGGAAAVSNTKYDEPAALKASLEHRGDGLFSKLSDDSVLETADVSELDTRQVTPAAVARKEEGTAVLTPSMDGIEELSLHSVKRTDDGILTVIVQPRSDDKYAVFAPYDEDELYMYSGQNLAHEPITAQHSAETNDVEVTPASTCSDNICNVSKTKTIRTDYLCGFGECVPITSCTCAA